MTPNRGHRGLCGQGRRASVPSATTMRAWLDRNIVPDYGQVGRRVTFCVNLMRCQTLGIGAGTISLGFHQLPPFSGL